MKLKFLAAASVVALSAVGAHADTDVNWGAHPAQPVQAGSWESGSFTNTYSFTLGAASSVTSSVLSFGSFVGGGYDLYSLGTDGLFGTADDASLGHWSFTALPGPAVNHTLSLAAGKYYYAVGGRAPSTGAGYSLSSSAVAAAVPEPETYAMLAAGLGVIGFLSSRRRRNS